YHYGYVIQAAAIASMIPEGGDELTSSLGSLIDSLWYDVCSNLPGGPDFPVSRHFSVYHGHSFASGLFPQGDGKSQESWSEAYNCYGACRRWARRRGDGRGEEWSGIMMGMERSAGHAFWWDSMGDMKAVVGDLKVSWDTWFGKSPWYRHGIQWMPIGPDTEFMVGDDGGYAEKERGRRRLGR
ncbi:hypothetical protein TrRE_jg3990, partial [Triparma retinervis]